MIVPSRAVPGFSTALTSGAQSFLGIALASTLSREMSETRCCLAGLSEPEFAANWSRKRSSWFAISTVPTIWLPFFTGAPATR